MLTRIFRIEGGESPRKKKDHCFSPTWRPFFVQEILNLIQGFVNVVFTLFDASSCLLLSRALLAEQSCSRLIFCGLQGENEDLLLLNTALTMLRRTLSSLIPLNIVKDHSRYQTEIPLLISYHSFWFSKLQNTKCPYAFLTLLLFNCLWRGAKIFPSGRVNFEVWLSKLWILIDRQLQATVRPFLNVSSTGIFVCNS